MKKPVRYRVTIEHYASKKRKRVIMRKVRESDCSWRFMDGKRGSELAYEWTPIKAVKIKEK